MEIVSIWGLQLFSANKPFEHWKMKEMKGKNSIGLIKESENLTEIFLPCWVRKFFFSFSFSIWNWNWNHQHKQLLTHILEDFICFPCYCYCCSGSMNKDRGQRTENGSKSIKSGMSMNEASQRKRKRRASIWGFYWLRFVCACFHLSPGCRR